MTDLVKTVEIDGKIFGIKKVCGSEHPCAECYFWKNFDVPCPTELKCYYPESIIFIEL